MFYIVIIIKLSPIVYVTNVIKAINSIALRFRKTWCMGRQGRNVLVSIFFHSVSCTCAIFCFPTLCIFTYIHYGGCNDICGSDFIIRGFVYLKSILIFFLYKSPTQLRARDETFFIDKVVCYSNRY